MKRYKSTLIFVLSYCTLNPTISYFFGPKYSTLPYVENSWLVFITAPFSYLESVQNFNVPFTQIMLQGFFSLYAVVNFWLITIFICVVEFLIPNGLKVGRLWIYPIWTYVLSMLATYPTSWIIWHDPKFGQPGTGTSIIGTCFLRTYAFFYGFYFASYVIDHINGRGRTHDTEKRTLICNSVRFILITIIGAMVDYVAYFSNLSLFGKHLLGLIFYALFLLVFLFLTQPTTLMGRRKLSLHN